MRAHAALLAVAATAAAASYNVDTVPRPQGRVADPDNLLRNPDAVEDALACLATKQFAWPPASPCTGTTIDGVEAVVVVVGGIHQTNRLQRYDDDERVQAATERFARGLHDKWGVGDKKCSNGALVVFDINDRSFYLSTGRGLRNGGLLGDARSRKALDASKAYLRAGDVDGGVLRTIAKVDEFLGAGAPRWREWLEDYAPLLFFLMIFGGMLLASVLQRRKEARVRREYEDATRRLHEVERIRDDETETYAAESCPVCLEDFGPTRPKFLSCGHAFCEPCLTRWMRENATCPVCRAPVSGYTPTPPDATPPRRRDDEVRYRLRRIHHRYPSVLERTVMDSMLLGGYRGGSLVGYARAPPPPPPRPSSSSRGGYSSASTYGGGSSSSGAGGRW
jgi:hypothetical protein